MGVPADAVQLGRERSEGIEAVPVGEDTRLLDAAEVEVLAAGDVDELYSRVVVVVSDAEVDPAARGEDDGDRPQLQHQVPPCNLHHFDDEPSR